MRCAARDLRRPAREVAPQHAGVDPLQPVHLVRRVDDQRHRRPRAALPRRRQRPVVLHAVRVLRADDATPRVARGRLFDAATYAVDAGSESVRFRCQLASLKNTVRRVRERDAEPSLHALRLEARSDSADSADPAISSQREMLPAFPARVTRLFRARPLPESVHSSVDTHLGKVGLWELRAADGRPGKVAIDKLDSTEYNVRQHRALERHLLEATADKLGAREIALIQSAATPRAVNETASRERRAREARVEPLPTL